jgi:hypothetical protein
MSKIVSFVLKNILTEKMVKKIVGVLGDYLVASTKNNLDNKLWDSVKKTLGV